MILLVLPLVAWAGPKADAVSGEHAAPAPAAVQVQAVPVPEGEPRQVVATPGMSLQAIVTSLPRGSQLRLSAGLHKGPLFLDRPMELSGEAGAILSGEGAGSVLVIGAPDVVVHDLHITGGGNRSDLDDSGVVVGADRVRLERLLVDDVYLGLDLRMAADGLVRDCTLRGDPQKLFGERGDAIRLWESSKNLIEGNLITDSRDVVVWYSADNVIRGNTVRGSRYGTHLMHSDNNLVEDNRYEEDVVGVFVMYSTGLTLSRNLVMGALGPAGVGFGFKESDELRVEGNSLISNTTGLFLDTTPHNINGEATFRDNIIAANGVGIRFHGPQYGGDFTHNSFEANRSVVAVDGGVDSGEYRIRGNHWSDYEGYDLDGDGLGDLPYEARSLSASLLDRQSLLRFFEGSPAMTLLDLFAEAFPMFRPPAILTDPTPLVRWDLTAEGSP
jgi:nitrous oxidase accessory protein